MLAELLFHYTVFIMVKWSEVSEMGRGDWGFNKALKNGKNYPFQKNKKEKGNNSTKCLRMNYKD